MTQSAVFEFANQTTRALYHAIVKAGANRRKLLDMTGLTADSLEVDEYSKQVALWRAGEVLLQKPDIALFIGTKASPFDRGAFGGVFLSSENLEVALNMVVSYLHILIDYIRFDITSDKKYLYVRYTYSKKVFHRYGLEHISSAFLSWISIYLNRRVLPIQASFQFSKPYDESLYYPVFKCPVSFEQPENLMLFPVEILSQKRGAHSEYMHNIMKGHVQDIANRLNKDESFIERAVGVIRRQLHTGESAADNVAEHLHMSKRTYYRKLTELGETHQQLLDKTRKEIAFSYLLEPSSQLKSLVFLLGYSDMSSLNRAFKRWTGKSPKHYIR